MAVYLNRTLSMVTGNSSPSHENGLDRSLGHNGFENSPLQIFVKAKKKINDIFGEIEEYVVETARFMEGKLSKYIYMPNITFDICREPKDNCVIIFLQITILIWKLLTKPKRNNFKVMYIKWLLYGKY